MAVSNLRHPFLNLAPYSIDHSRFIDYVSKQENLLVIQDLDGVCMGLVRDPLNRTLDANYIEATQQLAGHFFVLTNGEHVGTRGVNKIVESAIADPMGTNSYLPGLAAGGVQWQTSGGRVSHPGVSTAELKFLTGVPNIFKEKLTTFFNDVPGLFSGGTLARLVEAAILDNVASPTANLNEFYQYLRDNNRLETYRSLQQTMRDCCRDLLVEAEQQGLGNTFFVHYAPNDGRDKNGQERLRLARSGNAASSGVADSGTTDFQFMLQGAIKEAGVVALLNRYYAQRTGHYPLGEDFSVRQAPRSLSALLDLVRDNFDLSQMPVIIGVGDTVTSRVEKEDGKRVVRRGGSDRLFLQLIQNLGGASERGNVVVYVDSSQGEVKNRKPLKVEECDGVMQVTEGPGDSNDTDDPLTLDVVFPGGHEQYIETFQAIADQWSKRWRA
ncbi:MAG: glucosylglycerol 3-phosphatase [Cyanophyceae cyanobacterium]